MSRSSLLKMCKGVRKELAPMSSDDRIDIWKIILSTVDQQTVLILLF